MPFVSNTRYYEHRLAVAGRPAAGHYTGPVPATRAQAAPPRDLILTFYGLFREGIGGWISIAHLIRLMAEVDVDAPAVRSAVSRLKRRGLIEARGVAGAAGYSLSDGGQRLLAEGDPRILGRTSARLEDGWVLAVFSVPERERDRRHVLRSRLERLGFGAAAAGVWIAPQHLAAEARHRIESLGLGGYVELFEHARAPDGLPAAVRRWWDLDALAETYAGFCAAYEPMLRRWSRAPARGGRTTRPPSPTTCGSWTPGGRSSTATRGCPPTCCPRAGRAPAPSGSSSACARRCTRRPRST